MNKINTSPSIQRFERIYTEQAKLDKVAMQRHKIFVIAAGVAAAAFAVGMIAATPVISIIAGGTLLAVMAALATTVALAALASCAFGLAITQYYKRKDLIDNLDLNVLYTADWDLNKKTSSTINCLIRYGLVSEELADELTAFQKKIDESQIVKKALDIQDNYDKIKDEKQKKLADEKLEAFDKLRAEWFAFFSRIQNECPFPATVPEESLRPRPLYGITLKSLRIGDVHAARIAAKRILKSLI